VGVLKCWCFTTLIKENVRFLILRTDCIPCLSFSVVIHRCRGWNMKGVVYLHVLLVSRHDALQGYLNSVRSAPTSGSAPVSELWVTIGQTHTNDHSCNKWCDDRRRLNTASEAGNSLPWQRVHDVTETKRQLQT